MVNGSGLGDGDAANTNTPKIISRRHFLKRSCVSTPATLRITSISGSSKARPKPSTMADEVAEVGVRRGR